MYTYGDQPNEREKNQDLLEQSENDISRKNTEQVAGEREREEKRREGELGKVRAAQRRRQT